MAYIPKATDNVTVFPKTNSKDFNLAVRVIREKWERLYPKLFYEPIKSAPAQVASGTDAKGDSVVISAVPGQTKVDLLYGEEVLEETWIQPHSPEDSPAADAPNPILFEPGRWINAYVLQNPVEQILTRLGIDESRELLLVIPTIILDVAKLPDGTDAEIRCQPGDRFSWSNGLYEVNERIYHGYWKNSDIFLYVKLTANRWRRGS